MKIIIIKVYDDGSESFMQASACNKLTLHTYSLLPTNLVSRARGTQPHSLRATGQHQTSGRLPSQTAVYTSAGALNSAAKHHESLSESAAGWGMRQVLSSGLCTSTDTVYRTTKLCQNYFVCMHILANKVPIDAGYRLLV